MARRHVRAETHRTGLMPQWEEVRPILVAAYALMDANPAGMTDGKALAEALGRDPEDRFLERDLWALRDADYLDIYFDPEGAGPIQGTAEGRREVQGWPGPRTPAGSAELLVDLLDKLAVADQTPEPERGRLKKAADAIRDAGTDTIAKAIGEVIARSTGIS